MALVIGVMGESGSGKTTGMRNLDPKKTFYIDCDKKGLAWPGWRKAYSADKNNYFATDFVESVSAILKKVNEEEKFKHVEVVVIDTLNGLMTADEVRRMKEKNYDKWTDLAQCVWTLVDSLYTLRSDLTVVVLCHSQTQKEDDGYTFTRIKTSGKKLDKLCLESKLTTVLHAVAKGNGQYVFKTHADKSTTKTPLGLFEEDEVPNDIVEVIKRFKTLGY